MTHKTDDTAYNTLKINGRTITDAKGGSSTVLLAGSVAGVGATLCTDNAGNATTSGCAGGVTGPGTSTSGYLPVWNGSTGGNLGGGFQTVASVGSPGSQSAIPTEAAVR